MIFDKLCGVAERHLPFIVPFLKDAKIFEFKGIPHHILPTLFEEKTSEQIDDMCNSFFMPYQTIVVEDGASCILLHDAYTDTIGLDHERFFIEATFPKNSSDEFYDNKFMTKEKRDEIRSQLDAKLITVIFGLHQIKQWDKKSFGTSGELRGAMICDKKQALDVDLFRQLSYDESKNLQEGTLINISTAIQEIMFFNQPDKFILERRHIKQKKSIKDRIPRSHQRPIYTILHPAKIRRTMNVHHKAGKSPVAHERRRHVRYLSHPMYAKDKDGYMIESKMIPNGPRRGEPYYKKTVVPASWIGPSEAVVGNKRYRVILDR